MSNEWDNFDDIVHGESFGGIYDKASPGLDAGYDRINTVTTSPTPQGLALEFRCQGCGKTRRLTLEWPELVALKHQISPHVAFAHNAPPQLVQAARVTDPTHWTWRGKEGWGLVMRCNNSCNFHYPIRLAADEPDKYLRQATRLGLIDPQGHAHINALVQGYAQHLRSRQR